MTNHLFDFVEFEKTIIPEKIKFEIQAFSVYCITKNIIKNNSNDLPDREEIYYYRRWNSFKKSNKYLWVIRQLIRIGELLQNKDFSKKDLTLTVLFLYYYYNNIDLSIIDKQFVKETINKFSEEQYEKDKQFILNICKQVQIKGVEDLFKISEDGSNLLYKYIIEKKYISPIFYINLFERITTNNEEKSNNNYKKFQKISIIIKNLIKQ